MKFADLADGTKRTRETSFPYAGKSLAVAVRPLTGAEHVDVHAEAAEYAREKKATKAEPGDPIYDVAVMAFTIAKGVVEPADSAKAFFDDGGRAVLANLETDTIAYLYEQQEQWQSECSPYTHQMTGDELAAKVREVTAPNGPMVFIDMSPGMRWTFTLSLANQFLRSLEHNLLGGSTSTPSPNPES